VERSRLLSVLEANVENKNIIKHMFATEACMRALALKLKVPASSGGSPSEATNLKNEAINEEEWALAGLMHDGDYKASVPVEKQGVEITELLKKEGISIPESVAHAMAAHNWHNTGVEPKSLMDWSLFICDSLTGLIVAAALVLPSKKLADVTTETVLRRFKEKNFAKGTRREEIAMCEEKLLIKLDEFVSLCLEAMQDISSQLGL